MRKLNYVTRLVLLAVFTATVFSCDKNDDNNTPDVNLSYDQLTQQIKDYLANHFADNKFASAKKDSDSYEVHLNNTVGIVVLDFDLNSSIRTVDSKTKIPETVVPKKIREYVTSNYPKSTITGWEIEDNKQDVEIDDLFDLEFTMAGDFIRVDMDERDDVNIPAASLPEDIKTYNSTNFPDYAVVSAFKDNDGEYDVILEVAADKTKRVKLEFNGAYKIEQIQSSVALTAPAIDQKIVDFVTKNYADLYIVVWELDAAEQDVELNNRLDLVFDLNGNFLRIDMDDQDGVNIPAANLPEEIKTYNSTNFPEHTVLSAYKENDGDYCLILEGTTVKTNRANLEFNRLYKIKKIKSTVALTEKVINKKIVDYVTANYATYGVISWELDLSEQDVELNDQSRTDLVFDLDSNFLRVDR